MTSDILIPRASWATLTPNSFAFYEICSRKSQILSQSYQDKFLLPQDHLQLNWHIFFSTYIIVRIRAYDVIKYNI